MGTLPSMPARSEASGHGRAFAASLLTQQLYQDRDLAVTTDFRRVASLLLTRHLKLSDAALEQVCPGGIGAGVNVGGLIS